jgi:Spy/CpxP family protein refolding chaperone
MRALLAASTLVMAVALPALPQQAAAPPPAAAPASVDEVRQALRTDKRGLVERNMHLTAEEAKKFWPIYDSYQQELDRVVQRENRLILDFINAEDSMTDANAKRIAREMLRAEDDEQSLRAKQLRRMLAVLPAKKAVRYLQIENKLRALQRYDIAERMTLVR